MDPISATLRDARRSTDLSQKQLGALIGTTQSAVSELEQGKGVRLSTLRRWADALGYDLVLVKRKDG